MLTPTWDGFRYFFSIWARVMHYSDVLRLLVVNIMKMVGMITDRKTDYFVDDGKNLFYGAYKQVSMEQKMTSNDWYMESLGLTVSFSLFGDLMGISKWARPRHEALQRRHPCPSRYGDGICAICLHCSCGSSSGWTQVTWGSYGPFLFKNLLKNVGCCR